MKENQEEPGMETVGKIIEQYPRTAENEHSSDITQVRWPTTSIV